MLLRPEKMEKKEKGLNLFSQLYTYPQNFSISCLLQLSGGAGENSHGETALSSQGRILRDAEFVPRKANRTCECSDSPSSFSYILFLNTSV